MSKKKRMPLGGLTVALLSASVVLLAGSTVGSARAALTYYSENYGAQVEVSNIGVSLVENGSVVRSRDYTSNGKWEEKSTTDNKLLTALSKNNTKIIPGEKYDEELTVKNSGTIDTYVRVILKKSWINEKGEKDTTLSPNLINLNLLLDGKWMIDESASTSERTILYYTEPLKSGDETDPLSNKISIDSSIATKVKQDVTEKDGYKTITTTYAYDGYNFQLEAEADAVQTHNAQDAIKSAWGVDVDVDGNGNISLRLEGAEYEKENFVPCHGSDHGRRHTYNSICRDTEGGSDWKVEFDGSKMSSNFTSADMKKDIFQLQPGDTMELQVGLKNTSEKDADWYMTNEVLKSLEDSQSIAEGGAYGYKLTYVGPDKKETVLYDSETVGGEDAQKGEGLHQATDALEKYLYLDRLSKGDVASVHLTVKLDGETQGNDYQDTLASLQMSFAADPVTVTTVTKKGEDKVVNKTVTKTVQTPTKNVVRSPKTGDTTQILAISAVALASGVILLILAVVLIKKRKEEKGEGQR